MWGEGQAVLLLFPAAALLLSLLPPALSLDAGLSGEPEAVVEAESPAIFFLLPVLKSVSYQPLPFRRKAAADTFFFNDDFPHRGHSTLGASLSFCRTSSRSSQSWH